jgi:peptidoglycan LD-endopeptidase CwlK
VAPALLNRTSEAKLVGLHPDLVRVVRAAYSATKVFFIVTEGIRTLDRQKQLVAAGASTTMKSRHLTGHAVDLAAVVGGAIRWDWPLYYGIAAAMKQAAKEIQVPIEWGGDWETFKDGPHYQLPWAKYPAVPEVAP